jgi:hypothetical protein
VKRAALLLALSVLLSACAGTTVPLFSPSPSVAPAPAEGLVGKASPVLVDLARLAVKGRAPMTGYSRDQFGPAWTDDVVVAGGHNGCDTRNDVLARDLANRVLDTGSTCVVVRGTLTDPYTGKVIDFVRGRTSAKVQIDHMVALGNAWASGAAGISATKRRALANDPLNLQAVDGPTNEAKGDSDAATWLPPRREFWCTYVTHQVQVKNAYGLSVTQAEHDRMADILRSCP